ncbi:MAG TPA: methyltransferase domain-containing protein [Alphaproteobacteria bacterium]|nr:methyltransferase domain-containing protein [Alphaproteobacteria bacterium]
MSTAAREPMNLFDRRLVRLHRDRAAARLDDHDFLYREVAARLADRLEDITRDFAVVLDLGCHSGQLGRLGARPSPVESTVAVDISPQMARRAGTRVAAADEEMLPFADGTFDLVLSNLSLHWVNDLPGALVQVQRALKPDGLFLAAMLGGETLRELRDSFLAAELELESGAGPRVSPFADLRDAAALLQRAGFALPVADRDEITVTYPNTLALMRDLRGMGETNAVQGHRRGLTRRATLLRAAALYEERFADADGRIPATFQIIYMTGWKPHPSQQNALRPGSAQARLAEALQTREIPAGEAVVMPKRPSS